jgi:cytolysin (calcineurin-like family phosphatase)
MSDSLVPGGVGPADQLVAGGLDTGGLIPANTTLLQPGARFFRLSDATQYLDAVDPVTAIQQQLTALQQQVATNAAQQGAEDASLQGQINALNNQLNSINGSLQGQINTINTRLANAGIP